MDKLKSHFQPLSSPLGVIGSFLVLFEIVLGYASTKLSGNLQELLVWFVVILPCLLLLGFFLVLWHKPYVFYPPSEYPSGEDAQRFVDAIRGTHPDKGISEPKLSTLEIKLEDTLIEEKRELIEDSSAKHDDESDIQDEIINWMSHFWDEDYDTALVMINKQIKANKDDPIQYSKLRGYKGLVQGHIEFDLGIKILQELIDENPAFPDYYMWIANLYVRSKQYDDAIKVLEDGIPHLAENERAPLVLRIARIYEFDMNLHKKAIETTKLARIINAQSDDIADSYRLEGIAYKNLGDDELSIDSYKSAYRAAPGDINNINRIAKYFDELNRKPELLFLRKKLTQLQPDNPWNWGYLGNSYLDNDLNDLSMEAYRQSVKIDENQSWIIGNIGNLYNNVGLFSLAVEYLQKALTIDPESTYAKNRLSSALAYQVSQKEKETDLLNSSGF